LLSKVNQINAVALRMVSLGKDAESKKRILAAR
jgi:hypothetical protein